MNNNENILLFDGVCHLCNNLVLFIIKKDPKSQFKFAALQSEMGKLLLKKYILDSNNLNTVVYIKGERNFLKSTAILNIVKDLGGYWKLFYALIIIPKFIRDIIYDLIAKSRYRIFGKKESCMIPSPDINQRFYS